MLNRRNFMGTMAALAGMFGWKLEAKAVGLDIGDGKDASYVTAMRKCPPNTFSNVTVASITYSTEEIYRIYNLPPSAIRFVQWGN